MDTWFDTKRAWSDATLAFVERFVIARHDIVMYGKGRLDSCWLHADDGNLHFDQNLAPQFRASRFPQAVKMLRDLALLEVADGDEDDEGGVVRITREGRRALERVMESSS